MLFTVLLGCSQAVAPPVEECDAPTAVEIAVPRDCWIDDEACPPAEDAPWAECSRRYVCERPQPDGSDVPACVRASDCDCLRAFEASCSSSDVELPAFCDYQP